MSEKNINFNDKKINKSNFYRNKTVFKIDDIDVDEILVSKREPYGNKKSFQFFIGYNDNDKIRPLCIMLPQMVGYAKYFKSSKTMSLKVSEEKLLKKYTKIWKKIGSLIKVEFASELVYCNNDRYIKTEIQSCGDKINANFH